MWMWMWMWMCRLVTNVLYKWNDVSMITVLCTAEGFPDMWALLKLTKCFSEKLQQQALPPEYAHAFQTFSILHKLSLAYPTTSLSTFKFACTCLLPSSSHMAFEDESPKREGPASSPTASSLLRSPFSPRLVDLTMERMEFLNADPVRFHFAEVLTLCSQSHVTVVVCRTDDVSALLQFIH
jgi:hypothetical protein